MNAHEQSPQSGSQSASQSGSQPEFQSPRAPRTDVEPPKRFRRSRTFATVAAVVAAILGGLVVLLAAGNLFPAATNIVTLGAAYVWASYAPHFVLLSLIAALLCIPLWRVKRRPVLRAIASGVVAIALVASTAITAALVNAAAANGGSVNLARAVALASPPEGPSEITNYVTVDGEAQEARIFEPAGGPEGAPVMMYIHGGGWYLGTAEESDSLAKRWADQGWYVVSVNYRLADARNATWDKAPADVACALTWTDDRAAAAGADTSKLTVMGDSAGGHLAMLLGWSAAAGAAVSSCPEKGEVPVPDAVVAGYPVSNLDYTYDHGAAPLPTYDPQQFTRWFLGGAPGEVPDRARAVSPSTYLDAATPPTLVLQPERDDFIPAEGNVEVMEQAQQVGVDATIVSVPFAWHGFDAIRNSIGGQLKTSVTKHWLEERNLAP